MRLILATALLGNLILSGPPCYSQGSLHCIPIGESRVIHEYAVKYVQSIQLVDSLESKIVVLENRFVETSADYHQLLNAEKQKNDQLAGKFQDQERITVVTNDQNKALNKKAKRYKWQRNGLGGLLVIVIALALL